MNEKKVIITERDGTYQVQNEGIAEFALIGILECFLFELKSSARQKPADERKASDIDQDAVNEKPPEPEPPVELVKGEASIQQETRREAAPTSAAPEIRTRIANAVKAVRALGGKIEEIDLNDLTDEELQLELEELTAQYKRLKSSKATK